jgi:carbohydrate-selective porin OprB
VAVPRRCSVGAALPPELRASFLVGRAPVENTGGDAIDQWTFETYYRIHPTPQLSIVPSVQYLVNPAYSRDKDALWVMALRMRLTL